ncbi:hypothetical protein [Microbacterium sp. UBA3486]|uniref:hypothetical protein n=1 Tax=Microbacterium TaxID=33882 RepID=UPI0025F5B6D7|nr:MULTISPECIES: hypothetical protein [Microbacterium]
MTRSRHLALAAATAVAVTALSGCAPQASPESVAMSFSQAFMSNDGKLPSEFMCAGSPADEADGGRWTTDLASDLKIGDKSQVDGDGYQKIEVAYTRGSDSTSAMIVTVDTRNLCVTWAEGGHLSNSNSNSNSNGSSGESTDSESAPPAATPGEEGNPLPVEDGFSMRFEELVADFGSPLYIALGAGESFTVEGSELLDVDSQSGVEVTTSESGVTLTGTGEDGAVTLNGAIEGGASSSYEFEIRVVSE